jgi:predicted RNA-binding Zn-ribbon protein involved in translation (DUF1610 family)
MSVRANCPSCGGPVTFQVGTSLVTVCPYCNSVVGRGDRGLESLGKVADLVETGSPLDVGVKGRFDGVPFTLTGRTQFRHPAGGVWDEWYAAFADGRWGWLAEAQGRFYLTFEQAAPATLPAYDALRLGQAVAVGGGKELLVAEKNRGTTAGARGEMPYRVVPGQEVPFADLSGPQGEFGTIDFGGPTPALYVGREVTLDELGVPPKARRTFPGQEPGVAAVSLNCPQCGAALALRAPDRSERVGCPSCGALLDVHEGKLSLLESLQPPEVKPAIPLGAAGRREGVEWTAVGFMRRCVTLEGVDYFWNEYLLYQPRLGFRWLTQSDGHWNWVSPLPPGAVRVDGNVAVYAGQWYRLFQRAQARVVFVVGEFYWKVRAGEEVLARDYVHAPGMLSEEVSREGDEGEVNWSQGLYLPPAQVEKMFGLTAPLPAPRTVAPNEPFPYTDVYRYALYLFAAAVLLGVAFYLAGPRRRVLEKTWPLRPLGASEHAAKVIEDLPVELHAHENIRLTVAARGGAGWVYVNGSLVSAGPAPQVGRPGPHTPLTSRPFAFLAVNGQPAHVYLSSVPAGKYALQFDVSWQNPKSAAAVEVSVEQGAPHPSKLMLVFLLLGSVPLATAIYQLVWESRRWQDSNVT